LVLDQGRFVSALLLGPIPPGYDRRSSLPIVAFCEVSTSAGSVFRLSFPDWWDFAIHCSRGILPLRTWFSLSRLRDGPLNSITLFFLSLLF